MASTPKTIGLSNLDMTRMRIVKRGALVSWHGFRFYVSRVRAGTCYPTFPIELVDKTIRFLPCNSVQVVA